MLTFVVNLYHPESTPQRELDAVEAEIQDRIHRALGSVMRARLPKGAVLEVGGERIEEIDLAGVPRG